MKPTLPRIRYFPRQSSQRAGEIVWVYFHGILGSAALSATLDPESKFVYPHAMFGSVMDRDELITVEHNGLGSDQSSLYRTIIARIAMLAEGRRVVLVGLSLGGMVAAGMFRWITETYPQGLFEDLGLALISTPGGIGDLRPAMQQGVKLVQEHPRTIGQLSQFALSAFPGLLLEANCRRTLKGQRSLARAVRRAIRESARWLIPAVDLLACTDGFGPAMQTRKRVVISNLPPQDDDVIEVGRAMQAAVASFGNTVPIIPLHAPWHGTPWAHPEPYQEMVEWGLRVTFASAFRLYQLLCDLRPTAAIVAAVGQSHWKKFFTLAQIAGAF